MAAAQGTQLELGTKGILKKKESESLLQEEMLRICEVVLETPPLNRTVKQLKHLANMAKALGFTIGGPDVPEFVVVECWRYVALDRIPPSMTIMKQGTDSQFMCFVLDGLFDVFVNDEQINTVGFGAAVGELALMEDPVAKRSATLIARGPCKVARLDAGHYKRILRSEHERATSAREGQLGKLPLFSEWPAQALLRISRFLEKKKYKRGEAVLIQGKKNTKLFIVASGLVGIVVHITPESEVEYTYAQKWADKAAKSAALDPLRSSPTGRAASKLKKTGLKKTTVEVVRLGPGHHFSNVKRTADDPRKLVALKGRRSRNLDQIGELTLAMQPGVHAPFTVVCHTDCILYTLDLAKLQEQVQATDTALDTHNAIRRFYETSPEVPEGSYIRDLIAKNQQWRKYKTALMDDILERHSRRAVHGDMIAGENLVSRRSRVRLALSPVCCTVCSAACGSPRHLPVVLLCRSFHRSLRCRGRTSSATCHR